MRKWDILFTIFLILGIIPFFISWDLVVQISENSFSIIDSNILCLIALLYFFVRIINKKPKYKVLFLSIIFLVGAELSYRTFIHLKTFNLYSIIPYQGFYTNPNDSNETIALYHFGRTLHSYNTLCQVKKIDDSNFFLFKRNDKHEINGLWLIDEDNPIHDKKGLAFFENGKLKYYQ